MMSLYDKMLNIANKDQEAMFKLAIDKTKKELAGLNKEQMCIVYSSYLYNNLRDLSVLSYIVETTDLGFNYLHRFILVPDTNTSTYLLDLTYKQFVKDEDKVLEKLVNDGYQKIDNDTYNYYLNKVTREKRNDITLENSIFSTSESFETRLGK